LIKTKGHKSHTLYCFRELGLWSLTTLSTIFQLFYGGNIVLEFSTICQLFHGGNIVLEFSTIFQLFHGGKL
jgi:hypothetical protein